MIPFLVFATLLCFFGVGRRKWQQGATMTDATDVIAMTQEVEALPPRPRTRPKSMPGIRARGASITVYMPLAFFVIVLLFPFYWMAITSIKPDSEMYDYKQYNPFWVHSPTLRQYRQAAVRDRVSALADDHDGRRDRRHVPVASAPACSPPMRSSGCASRARNMSAWRSTWPIWCRRPILFIPLATLMFQFGLFDSPIALILTYPTFLVPFCTWLLIGYFKSIPYELEECALIDGASRLQILRRITLPLAVPGLISAGIFAFTLSWNEFIYALAFIQSTENKTVPVAILTELVTGDVYQWGSLMAGSLLGSVPVAIIYSFFVEYYVSSMTGAVKE